MNNITDKFSHEIHKRNLRELQKYKISIDKLISTYSEEHCTEIKDGTERRLLLLSNGLEKGLDEKEALSEYGKFIPSEKTPTLNLLYFMLRESENEYEGKYQSRDKINNELIKSNMVDFSTDDIFKIDSILNKDINLNFDTPEFLSEQDIIDYNQTKSEYRKLINEEFARQRSEKSLYDVLKEPPKMEMFLLGNLTLEQFDTLKKLKRLAVKNNNSYESAQALGKCIELCKKYGLTQDKIPI